MVVRVAVDDDGSYGTDSSVVYYVPGHLTLMVGDGLRKTVTEKCIWNPSSRY